MGSVTLTGGFPGFSISKVRFLNVGTLVGLGQGSGKRKGPSVLTAGSSPSSCLPTSHALARWSPCGWTYESPLTTESSPFLNTHPAKGSPFRKDTPPPPPRVEGLDITFSTEKVIPHPHRQAAGSHPDPQPLASATTPKVWFSDRVCLFCLILFFFGVGGSLWS